MRSCWILFLDPSVAFPWNGSDCSLPCLQGIPGMREHRHLLPVPVHRRGRFHLRGRFREEAPGHPHQVRSQCLPKLEFCLDLSELQKSFPKIHFSCGMNPIHPAAPARATLGGCHIKHTFINGKLPSGPSLSQGFAQGRFCCA